MKLIVSLLFSFLLVISTQTGAQVSRRDLTGIWQLRIDSCPLQKLKGSLFNTTIPSVLHLDLYRAGQIQDPYFGDNHQKLLWVSECNITYMKNVTFLSNQKSYELVFEGIDTRSTVKLNGKIILTTNNSFVQYRVILNKSDIKFDSQNLLEVEIYSTKKFDELANGKNRMPFLYAHTRKAAYQYSWDWAPNLNTLGIWKKVYVVEFDDISIDYIWIRNRNISEHSAVLNFVTSLKSNLNDVKGKYLVKIFSDQKLIKQGPVEDAITYLDVEINEPKLWWPNGIGQPNIYTFTTKLFRSSDNSLIDEKTTIFGIKTVQLDQSNNRFTVKVNGYPIYCKGANYVPMDMFYPRTNNQDDQSSYTHKKLIQDAVDSHFNMIRIWGGGQYESDEFLELASRNGIMLFYDFMFSDSIYPSNLQFIKIVETEITQQVRRTRNYPSLVLWSGNNEILQGIKSWGWSKSNYLQDYKIVFEQLIPAILKKQNPDIPYIASSPVNGIGNSGFERGGDIHYWGVWAGGANFEAYSNAIGPFNSEFGTQALPVWETILNFTGSQGRNYASPQLASHQKHNSKFNTLTKYIKLYGNQPIDFEHEVYLSGLVQAFGVQIAIRSQRASKPKSYGTLYWQMNDAWPSISWSSIDYFGRWKPLQYMAKRSYPDVAIFCMNDKIISINDNLYPITAKAHIIIQHFNGTTLDEKKLDVELSANQVKQIHLIQKSQFERNLNEVVIHTEIIAGRQKQMTSTYFYMPFKSLKLDSTAKLYVKRYYEEGILLLHTDKFIKNLYISSEKHEYIKLSDNYFDMIANRTYKVSLGEEQKGIKQVFEALRFRSYIQIHSKEKLQVIYE